MVKKKFDFSHDVEEVDSIVKEKSETEVVESPVVKETKEESKESVPEIASSQKRYRTPKEKTRNKVVQAKMFEEDYNNFMAINDARGMNTSAVLSMLITDYIRENIHLIDNNK